MTDPANPPRPRDRAATELALVAAARDVLAAEGFQGLGVNAVARAAGCDKQLIYRYFGGVDGLVDAVGAGIAASLREGLAPLAALGPPANYRDFVERMVLGFFDLLRRDALLQKIMLWEIAEPSPLVARLTAARSRGMFAWVAEARGSLTPPPGIDAPALNATLLAAAQHLVLAGVAVGQFSGLPLATDADWARARANLKALIAAAYPA